MADITVLLTGRIGNGKSSIGNSILGMKAFTPRSSNVSGPTEIEKRTSNRFGKTVVVVDGFDVGDVDENNTDFLLKKALAAFEICERKITVFILALKYGVRFTRQEKEAVNLIRSYFGKEVLKNHGVIVISHGDNFHLDMEDEGRNFQVWCDEQKGDVKVLFEECEGRIVLFNNKVGGVEAQQQQFEKFIEKVSEIKEAYTSVNFQVAIETQKRLNVKNKLPRLREESESKLEIFYQRLNQTDKNYWDLSMVLKDLDSLQRDIKKCRKELENEDAGTQILKELFSGLDILAKKVESKVEQRSREEKETGLQRYLRIVMKTVYHFTVLAITFFFCLVFFFPLVAYFLLKKRLWVKKKVVDIFHVVYFKLLYKPPRKNN